MSSLTKPMQFLRTTFQASATQLQFMSSTNGPKADVPYGDVIKEKDAKAPTSVPSEADVVVIGGGSLGCNSLYHLAKLGVTNTVLLESHQLTAGTTWHTAGLVWRLRPNDIDIELLNSTRRTLMTLEDETGVNPGWINNGGMFVASNKERLNEYKRLMTLGKAKMVESYVLGPSETKKLYPLMNVEDIYGTLYCPGDGTLEPAGYCTALTRSATAAGARVIEKCPVTEIGTVPARHHGKKVTGVNTPYGVIKTNCVINATGAWSNHICSMVGVEIPIVPMKHAYIVTEKIPGIENMPNVRDHDASVYLRLQGDALSIGGYENNPIFLEKMDKDFSFGLFDLDWDVFSAHIDGAVNRIPDLERTGIKSTVCGPESFTPDHKPIMGEDPDVMGFFHCCGFNSGGMMLGGGSGEQMAKWVINGRPELDMFGYDIRRFYSPLNRDRNWSNERSHEAYAKNYATVFPFDQPLAGRKKRMSPFHKVLESHGCVYEETHGWERPGWFHDEPAPLQPYDWYGAYPSSPKVEDARYKSMLNAEYTFAFPPHFKKIGEECSACRSNVGLFDATTLGKLLIMGKDSQKAADWIFTANMDRYPGATIYTCILNKNAGIEADLTASVVDGSNTHPSFPKFEGRAFYINPGGIAVTHIRAHILKEINCHNWDVKFADLSNEMAILSLQGRNSRSLMEALTGEDFSNDAFPFSTHRVVTVAGQKVMAIRLTFVGELGWELHMAAPGAESVLEAVLKEGKSHQLQHAGYRAMGSLSAEKAYRHWHADARSDDTPLEAGLGFTCKLKLSVQFLGREAIEAQKKKGLTKKVAVFTLDDPEVPLLGYEAILRNDNVVGYLRVADFAHTLGKSIGTGYVSMPDRSVLEKYFLKSGSWQIESMGTKHSATLHTHPPFDPKNLRVKGTYAEQD